ncbi:SprT-like family-domain-containing protein [Exophiala viscosa]|uniref:SprT-like family-domain-containing protein n=1 Tax=Exophiala viscosa TaxID=2486360 RepID=UPI00219DDD45|nr:SprT-like family-domain-containing protein [Exophiala viscosa]
MGSHESRTKKQGLGYASRFVLNEARCNDDAESSMEEEDEDEDTDLSGFIVDDDAELSYHDSAGPDSEGDARDQRSRMKSLPRQASRRRLQRGRRNQRRVDSSDHESNSGKENNPTSELFDAMRNMRLHEGTVEAKAGVVEVIDLTSSPPASPKVELNTRQNGKATLLPHPEPQIQRSSSSNPFEDFDTILRLAPPSSRPKLAVPSKIMAIQDPLERAAEAREDSFKTPPATPPRSSSKLKSPSKLLSPSKRQAIPRSPHRQSMDDFWDHNVINEWIDEYSPKKAPTTSPRKGGLARFQIWSDSEDDDQDQESSTPLPRPFSSPRKTRAKNQLPVKSPEKEEKKRLLDEKRAALARKKAFDSRKEQLAVDLLEELDMSVAGSELAKLASSTGGVRIVWSKILRSTAGRANWKRTVIKSSGSPVKGGEVAGPGIKVQHFASIELAEKIVDCEDRLVNTVAHEFCHLTNFMISNIRDQPHGASFKQWAERVTSYLRASDVEIWRKVEVTTKHSYVINHKYLWVCVGREQTPAMNFLNINDEDGCGAEYGRHSKSIDPDKHRCGKCKGKLVQVRPKPRASPVKKSRMLFTREDSAESAKSNSTSGSSNSGMSNLETMTEVVELSD